MLSRTIVMQLGCEDVASAADGEAAVATLIRGAEEGAPFSVVILDANMPKMDGYTTARAMRSAGFAGVLLGCTGASEETDLARFLAAGADAVVRKPVDNAHVCELVRTWVERKGRAVPALGAQASASPASGRARSATSLAGSNGAAASRP
jgi:CheY-like chemotaxis protein